MPWKCVVTIRSDEGAVQRSLALDSAPSTLEELSEHLKTLDLRLQALPFTVSARDTLDADHLTELTTDTDVAKLWKADGGDVTLDVRIQGTIDPRNMFSSTYFGSEVVSIIIYPPLRDSVNPNADVIEKQFVIPLTGTLASLQRAIYCSLPTTAGLRASDLTVFCVTTEPSRKLIPLSSDSTAEPLLREHAKSGTSFAVTYSIPEKAVSHLSRKPHASTPTPSSAVQEPQQPDVPPQSPLPPKTARSSSPATSLSASLRTQEVSPTTAVPTDAFTTDDSAAQPPLSGHPTPSTRPAHEVPHQAAEQPAATASASVPTRPTSQAPTRAPTGAEAAAPQPAKADQGTPKADLSPQKRDQCVKVRITKRKSDLLTNANTVDFWYRKRERGVLERLVRLCEDGGCQPTHAAAASDASLCVLYGGQLTPLTNDADVHEWLVMSRESQAVLTLLIAVDDAPPRVDTVPTATVEQRSGANSSASEISMLTPTLHAPRTPKGASSRVTAAPLRRFSAVDAVAASATGSPPRPTSDESASHPSHGTEAPGPLKATLSDRDAGAIPVFISAPPAVVDHTGLEALAQLFVRWDDAEAFVQCRLRPGLMLEDLRAAILCEFGAVLRTTSSMQLFVRDRWRAPDNGERLDTEARLRELVESASVERVVIEIRGASRATGPTAASVVPQIVTTMSQKLAQRLFYFLASCSEMSALQRLLEPCEARLEAANAPAQAFFATIRAVSPTLTLPRTVQGLTDFIVRVLDGVGHEDAFRALQQCLTQCHCVCIAQPLSLLRDQYFAEASFTDVCGAQSMATARISSLQSVHRLVDTFSDTEPATSHARTDDSSSEMAKSAGVDASMPASERSHISGFLTDLFAKDVECMNSLSKARACGALQLSSRLSQPPLEVSEVIAECLRRELKHSFDSCSVAHLEAFIQSPDVTSNAAHATVLSMAGGLLAPHPVANGTLWLRDHFKNKMADVLYVKMRTFDRSDAVALPHLIKCCWTILDPALDPSQLLVTSPSASCVSRWVLLALQLECLHRGLVFPPPPPYNIVKQGPHPVSFSSLPFRVDSTTSSSAPSTTSAANQSRERGKPKNIQYRYKFHWNELASPMGIDRPAVAKK